jgi:VIT1/CCC1 family predicted Fe2+/Mn2+ transporter
MASLAEKGSNLKTYLAVRAAKDPGAARGLIAGALPGVVAEVLQPAELDSIHQRLQQLPNPPEKARLDGSDWKGFLGVFLLVFLSTFPVTIPFIFMSHLGPAMRVSNAIAIVMLFGCGVAFGRITGRNSWFIGTAMVILGLVLVGMTMALGG